MTATLFIIGTNLSKDKLKELGARPFIHGIILWTAVSAICFVLIKSNVIGI